MKAIPAGLTQLVLFKIPLSSGNSVFYPALRLGGILDQKSNNKHIHKIFQMNRKITLRGTFHC